MDRPPPSTTSSPGRVRGRAGLVACCVVLAVVATHATGPVDGVSYRLVYEWIGFVTMIATTAGAWHHRRTLGLAGFTIAASLVTSTVADLGVTLNLLVTHSDAYPNWTDGFFIPGYLLQMAGVLLIVRRRRLARSAAAMIDASIVSVGVGVVTYQFVIAGTLSDSTATPAAKAVSILYPLLDVLIVGFIARLLFGSGAHRGMALMIAGAMTCQFVGDMGFTFAVLAGRATDYGRWIDAVYVIDYLLLGAAFWQKDTDRLVTVSADDDERLGPLRMVILALGGLLAPLTLLFEVLRGPGRNLWAPALGGIVLFGLTLIRMALLVRAVESQSRQLAHLARTDALTGLANRRTFEFELDRAMTESRETGAPVSLAIIDLDHFKRFNDSRGHSEGDQLLRECAAHWSEAITREAPRSMLARFGGEEFVVVFRGLETVRAVVILDRMMPVTPMGQTYSAGVATWDGSEPALDLLNRADRRLYVAKDAGRHTVVGDPVVGDSVASSHSR